VAKGIYAFTKIKKNATLGVAIIGKSIKFAKTLRKRDESSDKRASELEDFG